MSGADDTVRRDIALVRYLDALAAEDLDTIEAVWKQAESDPALESCLVRFNADQVLDQPAALPPAAVPGSAQARARLDRIHADLERPPGASPDQLVEARYTGYRCSVLVVEDDSVLRGMFRSLLARDYEVLEAASPDVARDVFARRSVDVLLTDLCLLGPHADDLSGLELVEWVRQWSPRTVCLLMSGYGTMDTVIEAINRGHVLHYLAKPFNLARVEETLRQASRAFTLERKNHELLERLKELNMELEDKVRQRTRELVEAVYELDQKNKTLEKLALTDALTGLPNRRAMDHLAERELLWRKRHPGPLALGLIDIDQFKNVNTVYRWSGGDRVLTEVARCMSGHLREIDHLGRYGGEEFMIIAPQADRRGAEILAERLRSRVEALPILYKGQTIRATVSVGLAVLEQDAPADLDVVRDACEAALATAKAGGRNRWVVSVVGGDEGRVVRRAGG
jgi:diguanylate cyclase (GGDEF)-like protein